MGSEHCRPYALNSDDLMCIRDRLIPRILSETLYLLLTVPSK